MDGWQYARFKRLMEYYTADPAFRKNIKEDPGGVALRLGLPQEDGRTVLAAAEDIIFGRVQQEEGNVYAREWRKRIMAQASFAVCAMEEPRYCDKGIYAYANNTLSRAKMESAVLTRQTQIRYTPLAYELSDGCKVQCPFCGLAAKPWRRDFSYKENRTLWQEILAAAKDVLGDVADQAPLYFATEPFDNPDYEAFLKDVEALGGYLPQTTTAVAERDVGRTKAFMAYLGKERMDEQARLRFSVRTLPQFYKIMETFSPEELIGIELLMNNKDSIQALSVSGRAREDSGYKNRPPATYSISCLCGIKVNLCEKTLTFIEPEKPDEKSPLGLRIKRTVHFSDGASFAAGLRELYAAYASPVPAKEQPLSLNRHIRVIRERERIILAGEGAGYQIPLNRYTTMMTTMLAADKKTCVRDMVRALSLKKEAADEFMDMITALYQKGYLVAEGEAKTY